MAIIATGYLIDFLTIGSLFYIASLMFAYAGVVLCKNKAGKAFQLKEEEFPN